MHEHPEGATSWKEKLVVEMASLEGVDIATVDMCALGMRVDTGKLQGPARKRTRILSNSREVLKRVAVSCPNLGEDRSAHHVHVPLESGRAKRCQVYPREFSRRVCEGIAAEKRLRLLGMVSRPLMELGTEEAGRRACDDLHEADGVVAFDDQSGEPLVPSLMRAARVEEMQYFKEMKVYEKVSIKECMRVTGRKPIGVRWVDINKGDSAQPNYRSRLVAKEFKGKAVALTFVFTRCPLPDFCPRMTGNFHGVYDELTADASAPSNWHLLSLSFDVDHDTPAVLNGYSKANGCDSKRWSFLTGALIEIDAITEQFGLGFAREVDGPFIFSHNLRTIVLDPRGRIQRMFIGNDWSAKELAAELRKAAKIPMTDSHRQPIPAEATGKRRPL